MSAQCWGSFLLPLVFSSILYLSIFNSNVTSSGKPLLNPQITWGSLSIVPLDLIVLTMEITR